MPATAGGRDTLSGNAQKLCGTTLIGTTLVGAPIWLTVRDTLPTPVVKIGLLKIGTFKIGQRLWEPLRDVLSPTAGTRDIL